MTLAAEGVVNPQGNPFPVVTADNGDVVAGAEEYGSGRVVLIIDIKIFDITRIEHTNSLLLSVNPAIWLIHGKPRY